MPLLYYLILPKIDAGWAISSRGSGPHQPGIPLLGWLTTFGPVVLASIPGWRTRATSDRQRLLRLWPIAVLITFVAVPTGKFHAFAGVSVPLALLAVQGWRRVLEERRLGGRNPRVLRFLVTAGVVVLVFGAAPATTWLLIKNRLGGRAVAELDRPDADALDYLARQPRGGVLSTAKVGIWVPALTDDSTYVGHFVWSPQWARRRNYVSRLFDYPGKRPLSPTAALALIEQPGARYVLEPCGARAKLWPLLKPRGYSRHAFGCATVYSPADPRAPLSVGIRQQVRLQQRRPLRRDAAVARTLRLLGCSRGAGGGVPEHGPVRYPMARGHVRRAVWRVGGSRARAVKRSVLAAPVLSLLRER